MAPAGNQIADPRDKRRGDFVRRSRRALAADERRHRGARHVPPVQQRRDRAAQHRQLDAGEQQPQRLVGLQPSADRAEREVHRLVGEPRDLGFVGDLESGFDVAFERKLVEQREAEGVDGRDLDVGDATAGVRARPPASRRRRPRGDCSSAMTRSRISAAAFRVNVIARMWRGSTPASSSRT